MAAGRGNAVGRRSQNADIAQLLAILRSGNHLTGKGERRIKRALGNAVALMAKPCDGKFTHLLRLTGFLPRRKCLEKTVDLLRAAQVKKWRAACLKM